MRAVWISVLASLVITQTTHARKLVCHANNCARQVTGKNAKPASSIRLSHCSSFLLTTITPATSTSTWTTTTTSTVTSTIVLTSPTSSVPSTSTIISESTSITDIISTSTVVGCEPLRKRQQTEIPSGVPAYASDCSSEALYRTACLCWGVTASTIFATTPIRPSKSISISTSTVTSTSYVTATTTFEVDTTVITTVSTSTTTTVFTYVPSSPTDNNNCGSCGHVCPAGTTCRFGHCKPTFGTCASPLQCNSGTSCATGCGFCQPDSDGDGYCLNGLYDPNAKCKISADCPDGATCIQGCLPGAICVTASDFCSTSGREILFVDDRFKSQGDLLSINPSL